MPSTSPLARSSLFGSTVGKLADNAAAFFNGMIGKENKITGVHVEVAGSVVAAAATVTLMAYIVTRPNVKNVLYLWAAGLFVNQTQSGNISLGDKISSESEDESAKKNSS